MREHSLVLHGQRSVLNEDRFTLKSKQLTAPSGAMVRACLELKTSQKIDLQTWRDLVGSSRDLHSAQEKMQGSREERVTRFESAVWSLSQGTAVNPEVASFLCGYLASLIDPGSLSHVRLVSPFLDRFPTAMLWYGLCAGLQQKSDVLSQFNALGRRVLRDIVNPESLLGRPQSDIAIDELDVFLRGDKPLRDFHRSSPRHISIELSPRIHTIMNWPDRSGREQRDSIESRGYADIEYLAKQLGQAIQSLNRIRSGLEASKRFETGPGPREKALPPTSITKDRSKRRR